ILFSIGEGNVGSEEAHALGRIGIDELPHATAQNSPDQDIRVENDHLSGYALPATTQLLELAHQLFFVNIRQSLGKAICGGLQFGKIGGHAAASASSRNVEAVSLAAARDGNRSVRLQKRGNSLAELADANFDRGHGHALLGYPSSVPLCVHKTQLRVFSNTR